MRYLILSCLFLVGCNVEKEVATSNLYAHIDRLDRKIRSVESDIDLLKTKKEYPIASLECVYFAKHIDTHAIASITIPVSGEYKIQHFGDAAKIKYLNAGDNVDRVQAIMRSTCPQYKEFK